MTAPLPPCRHCAEPIYLTEVEAGWVWVHTGGWFACRIGPAHLSPGTYAAPIARYDRRG